MNNEAPRKIFRLERIEDDNQPILNARDELVSDQKVCLAARLLGVAVLDLAVRRNVYLHFGAVMMSLQAIADFIGCSKKSVCRWKAELERAGHFWFSDQDQPNMSPMSIWHVTRLDPKEGSLQRLPGMGVWGNGKRRTTPLRKIPLAESGEGGVILTPPPPDGQVHIPRPWGNKGKPPKMPEKSTAKGPVSPLPRDRQVHCQGTQRSLAKGPLSPLPRDRCVPCQGTGESTAKGPVSPLPGDRCVPGGVVSVCAGKPVSASPVIEKAVVEFPKQKGGGSSAKRATPPLSLRQNPDPLKKFIAMCQDLFPAKLKGLIDELAAKLRVCKPPDRPELRRRLKLAEAVRHGATQAELDALRTADFTEKPARRDPLPAASQREATDEELLAGAVYLAEHKQAHLMNDRQRELYAAQKGATP